MMYKNRKYYHKHFTLVELLVVLFIIGILSGLVFPAFAKVRIKAKYVRWLTYNIGFNRDSDTVINFNFEKEPYQIVKNDITSEAVKNLAVACDAEKFNSDHYCGIMKNSPEWIKGGGRWSFKNAMQFDGRNDYIEIANNLVLDFDPTKDAFTIIVWANFYSLSNNILCAKGDRLSRLQYGIYTYRSRIAGAAGKSSQDWKIPELETMRWYQLALVNDPGEGYKVYVDGNPAEKPRRKKPKKVISITRPDLKMALGGLLVPGKTVRGKVRKDKVRNRFRGRIDEFLLLKRVLSEREIKQNYLMGNPY